MLLYANEPLISNQQHPYYKYNKRRLTLDKNFLLSILIGSNFFLFFSRSPPFDFGVRPRRPAEFFHF
jgi:hypothetical protein